MEGQRQKKSESLVKKLGQRAGTRAHRTAVPFSYLPCPVKCRASPCICCGCVEPCGPGGFFHTLGHPTSYAVLRTSVPTACGPGPPLRPRWGVAKVQPPGNAVVRVAWVAASPPWRSARDVPGMVARRYVPTRAGRFVLCRRRCRVWPRTEYMRGTVSIHSTFPAPPTGPPRGQNEGIGECCVYYAHHAASFVRPRHATHVPCAQYIVRAWDLQLTTGAS